MNDLKRRRGIHALGQRATWTDETGQRYLACWYPQMGGYVAKCVVVMPSHNLTNPGVPDEAPCFEAYVWHDGEFPFGADSNSFEPPAHLHHCAAEQFIGFGQAILELSGVTPPRPSPP